MCPGGFSNFLQLRTELADIKEGLDYIASHSDFNDHVYITYKGHGYNKWKWNGYLHTGTGILQIYQTYMCLKLRHMRDDEFAQELDDITCDKMVIEIMS